MTTPAMRRLLVIAAALVLLIGVPLFLFPGSTSDSFAWTVDPPLTAAFFGAGYWAAGVLEIGAARRRRWDGARIAVPAVLAFTVATLVVTLLHLDRFHFDHPSLITRVGTWGWMMVYASVPPAMVLVTLSQVRKTGRQRDPRPRPMGGPLRRAHAGAGAGLGAFGLGLLVAPGTLGPWWPWALSTLTARAVGAWVLGIGVVVAHMAAEGDWHRNAPASAAAGALGLLQGIALLRHLGEPDWGRSSAWGYVAVLVALFALGTVGVRRAPRSMRRVPDSVAL